MEELERKESPKKYFFMAATLVVVMVGNFERLGVSYPIIWTALIVVLGIFLWVRYGNKPAAWIDGEELYIWNGLVSPMVLNKNEITELQYFIESRSAHRLDARLNTGSTQHIQIHEKIEHIEKNRLMAFINEKYMPVTVIDESC